MKAPDLAKHLHNPKVSIASSAMANISPISTIPKARLVDYLHNPRDS